MSTITDDIQAALALLREDQKQSADDLLTKLLATTSETERQAAGLPPTPPPPRASQDILHDILTELTALFGNKQSLLDKLAELKTSF